MTNFQSEEPAARKPGGLKSGSYWQSAQAIHKQINGVERG
jgi:hypothetical protein